MLHQQIFELAYHSNGGFNQDIVYNLPVYLRNFYYKCLIEAKQKESEAYEKTSPSPKKNIASPPKIK